MVVRQERRPRCSIAYYQLGVQCFSRMRTLANAFNADKLTGESSAFQAVVKGFDSPYPLQFNTRVFKRSKKLDFQSSKQICFRGFESRLVYQSLWCYRIMVNYA